MNCCKSKWTHALESWISKPALGLLHFLYDIILLYFFFILFFYLFFFFFETLCLIVTLQPYMKWILIFFKKNLTIQIQFFPIGNDGYEAGQCNKISTQWLIKIINSIYRGCRNVRHQWTLHILNVRCLSFANFVFSNINEKKDIFVLFHKNKLDKNNFRVSQRGASNLRSPNIKPELHCKYCNSQS